MARHYSYIQPLYQSSGWYLGIMPLRNESSRFGTSFQLNLHPSTLQTGPKTDGMPENNMSRRPSMLHKITTLNYPSSRSLLIYIHMPGNIGSVQIADCILIDTATTYIDSKKLSTGVKNTSLSHEHVSLLQKQGHNVSVLTGEEIEHDKCFLLPVCAKISNQMSFKRCDECTGLLQNVLATPNCSGFYPALSTFLFSLHKLLPLNPAHRFHLLHVDPFKCMVENLASLKASTSFGVSDLDTLQMCGLFQCTSPGDLRIVQE